MKRIVDGRKDIACLYTLSTMSVWTIALKSSAETQIADSNLMIGINIVFAALPISLILFSIFKLCQIFYWKSKYGLTIIDYYPSWQIQAFDAIGFVLGFISFLNMLFSLEMDRFLRIVAFIIVPLIVIRFFVQALYGFVPAKKWRTPPTL